jgi:outer membrane protein
MNPFIAALLAVLPQQLPGAAAASALPAAEAVRSALAHDPVLGAARANADAAWAARGEARAAWFPTVTLGASATHFQLPMLVTPIHGFTPGLTPPFEETLIQGHAQLAWTIFDGGARGSRMRAARTTAQAGDALRVQAEQALISRVLGLYLQVLGGADVLAAHDRRLQALQAERERARLRVETGRAPNVELLRADAAVAQAEAERVRIVTRLDAAERDLARVTGVPVERTRAARLLRVGLRDTVLPDRAAALARAHETNAAVDQARHDASSAQAATSLARSARWPRLEFAGAWVDRGSTAGEFTDEWNVGVQLSYPLFRGGAVSSNIARAAAAERGSALRVQAALAQAGREFDAVYGALEEQRARVQHLVTLAARFAEVVRIEALRLETGTGTQTDYVTAEAELLAARASLVEAQYGVIAARVELARITGDLDADWLAGLLVEVP